MYGHICHAHTVLVINVRLNRSSRDHLVDSMPLYLQSKLRIDSNSPRYEADLNFPDLIIDGKAHIIDPVIGDVFTSPVLVKG